MVGDKHDFAVGDALEMLPVGALAIALRRLHELVTGDPAVLVGDLLHDRDRQTLRTLHGAHELPRLEQRVHRARVQPRIASAQRTHVQHARVQVHAIQVCDLQLISRRGPDPLGVLDHVLIVEVQAGHRVMRLRMRRLLLDGHGLLVLVELDHAITLRIVHVIAEHARATAVLGLRDGLAQGRAQAVAVEDVVAQHERAGLAADELLADGEGLRQAVRAGLLGVGEVHAVARAVPEQAFEVGEVRRRGDDQDVPDARKHEGAKRVVDHGLVVDRQQLLGGHERKGVQAGSGPAGEDDAFHNITP